MDQVIAKLVGALRRAQDQLSQELSGVRSSRANPAMVDSVEVEAYGSKMKLRDLAHISAPEPRLIVVQPWDGGLVEPITKSLQNSGLGINPAVDGTTIRLPLPPLNEERRQELVKIVHTKLEEARIQVRQARQDANEALARLKKDSQLTEDDVKRGENQVQREVDRATGELETSAKAKEQEVLTV